MLLVTTCVLTSINEFNSIYPENIFRDVMTTGGCFKRDSVLVPRDAGGSEAAVMETLKFESLTLIRRDCVSVSTAADVQDF